MAEERSGSVRAEASADAITTSPALPVGKIMQYTSDWQNYIEQLDFFFIANNETDLKRKKAILMATCQRKHNK